MNMTQKETQERKAFLLLQDRLLKLEDRVDRLEREKINRQIERLEKKLQG